MLIRSFITRSRLLRRSGPALTAVIAASFLLLANTAYHKEVQVMTSGAFTAPLLQVIPDFEKRTSIEVTTAFGASMGNTPESIPNRIARGEPVDLVILADSALDALIKGGQVVAGSRVELVRSSIGMVVRAGAPKPDIRSVEALKRTLLNAKSIAYSDSASGVYISTEMFQRLGIADLVVGKSKKIEGERVAAVVARGDAEIGFQQISELLPVPGADYVGPLPPAVQRVTVFSAGIAVGAKHPDAARTLIRFLTSPAVARVIKSSGLEQVTTQKNGAKPEQRTGAPVSREQVTPAPVFADRVDWRTRTLSRFEPVLSWLGECVMPFSLWAKST
jgi:molybdate transport system substrate-binding protein